MLAHGAPPSIGRSRRQAALSPSAGALHRPACNARADSGWRRDPLHPPLPPPLPPAPTRLPSSPPAARPAVNLGGNQDWDTVVLSKKRPTAAAAQKPANVNAAIRAGAARGGPWEPTRGICCSPAVAHALHGPISCCLHACRPSLSSMAHCFRAAAAPPPHGIRTHQSPNAHLPLRLSHLQAHRWTL